MAPEPTVYEAGENASALGPRDNYKKRNMKKYNAQREKKIATKAKRNTRYGILVWLVNSLIDWSIDWFTLNSWPIRSMTARVHKAGQCQPVRKKPTHNMRRIPRKKKKTGVCTAREYRHIALIETSMKWEGLRNWEIAPISLRIRSTSYGNTSSHAWHWPEWYREGCLPQAVCTVWVPRCSWG